MNNKKNIALFAPSIGFGGTERVVCRLVNELVHYYNVNLVVLYNSIDLPIHKEVNIISISNKSEHFNASQFAKTVDFIKSIFKYEKILRQNNISVSISFLVRQNVVNSIAKMFNSKTNTIISERCFPSHTYGSFGKLIVKYFYNKNDLLFSNSEHINIDLQNNFNLNIPAQVIYNPIKTLEAIPSFTSYNRDNDTFKIISVGRLNPVKNQLSLIRCIALLNEHFLLNIYGIGILEDQLKLETKSLNLNERVNFKGNIDAIHNEIVKHHCLVLTSLSEGFPNVILEAMSLGVPVIATNCMSGPLELLNDNEAVSIEKGSFFAAKYGLLVNVDDEHGLAEAIKYYQNNEDVRMNYSTLSFQKARQFDISKIGMELKKLIDSLCVE
ncbi:glycosyltransferase [Oceanihabitans sp.]|nr:glycosyltransferase [Oceanihabitans sp.]